MSYQSNVQIIKNLAILFCIGSISLVFIGFAPQGGEGEEVKDAKSLSIGWASADITPDEAVAISGGSSARVSQGVKDPITATALVLESDGDSGSGEMVVMISVDLVSVSDDLSNVVKNKVRQSVSEIDVNKIIINATHTHTSAETRTAPDMLELLTEHDIGVPVEWARWGIDLGVMSPGEYVKFAADRIAGAIEQAWKERQPGGISFGMAHAVIGQNRLISYYDGSSEMYGDTDDPEFSHVEGYEDHSLNLMYTWDTKGALTGVMINTAIPSQAEYGSRLSADYWHETRRELRRRLGEDLFVLPQTSAAGDQSPRMLIDHRAETRMQQLAGRSQREQIAVRITDAVTSILPYMEKNIQWDPVLRHRMEQVELSRRRIAEDDIYTPRRTWHRPEVETVPETFERLMGEYKKMYKKFEKQPELKEEPNWYGPITAVFWRLSRAWRTLERFEQQDRQSTLPIEVHVIRVGDMAIATNPFELYIDFGMQMKARSKAVQTFIVELAGPSRGYVPTHRSVAGGAYGAIPQSTQIGPEGGRELVNRSLELIDSLWDEI